MALYQAYAHIVGEIYIGEIEAEDETEALEKAKARYERRDLDGELGNHQLDDIVIETILTDLD